MKKSIEIQAADGKLSVLTPGMGALATILVAGVYIVRNGLGQPIGSLTQMRTIRRGKRTNKRIPMIKDFVPLAGLEDLVLGGWDILEDNMHTAAVKADVIERQILDGIRAELESVKPMPAVFDQSYVKQFKGTHIKKGKTKMDLALFMDLAARAGMGGIQEWLSFYHKNPMVVEGLYPEHDLFIQLKKMKNTLRHMKGEDLITHLGLEYYD